MKKTDKRGNAISSIETSQGMVSKNLVTTIVGDSLGHAGFKETGKQTIDTDVAGSVLFCQITGKAEQCGFGSGISCLTNRRVDGGEA